MPPEGGPQWTNEASVQDPAGPSLVRVNTYSAPAPAGKAPGMTDSACELVPARPTPPEAARGCRRLPRLPALGARDADGVRGRPPQLGGDVRRRATGRPRGPGGRAVRRPGRPRPRRGARRWQVSIGGRPMSRTRSSTSSGSHGVNAGSMPSRAGASSPPAAPGSRPSSPSCARACSSASAPPRRSHSSVAISASRNSAASGWNRTSPST